MPDLGHAFRKLVRHGLLIGFALIVDLGARVYFFLVLGLILPINSTLLRS